MNQNKIQNNRKKKLTLIVCMYNKKIVNVLLVNNKNYFIIKL